MGTNLPAGFFTNKPGPLAGAGLAAMEQDRIAKLELTGALPPETLTILDGSINPTRAAVIVDTEDGAPADDLTVIATTLSDGGSLHDGMELRLQAKDASRVVTVRNSASVNGILTKDGADVALSTEWWLILRLENGTWRQVSVSEPIKTGTNIVNSSGTISVANATTAGKGVVQLSSAVNSAAETLAATPKAVKTAYDKAVAAQNAATASGPSYNASTGKVSYPGYPGEFRNFMLATTPVGWLVRNGAVLSQADTKYPKLWAALNSSGMAFLKKTLEQWNALSQAAGGVGGVPFFVVDTVAKTIKLPDTRGDYERGAGSSYLETVGAWHGDAVRNITGFQFGDWNAMGGAFKEVSIAGHGKQGWNINSGSQSYGTWELNASYVVPTASENRTRAFAVLPCVYVG